MIAKLFNAPSESDANTIGTSSIGSSEAIMVGDTWRAVERLTDGSSWVY